MRLPWIFFRTFAASALAAAISAPLQVHAQQKEVKIGVVYDYTGPFAAGGPQARTSAARRW